MPARTHLRAQLLLLLLLACSACAAPCLWRRGTGEPLLDRSLSLCEQRGMGMQLGNKKGYKASGCRQCVGSVDSVA